LSKIVSHLRFPLRVLQNATHVYILDAGDRAFATVAYSKRVPHSREYARLVCTAQARALTDVFDGKMPNRAAEPVKTPPEDLPFKVELWFDDDSAVQQVLARFAKATHAQLYFDAIRAEYHRRNLRVRQGIRVVWETKGKK
jgi:hypothetical protein